MPKRPKLVELYFGIGEDEPPEGIKFDIVVGKDSPKASWVPPSPPPRPLPVLYPPPGIGMIVLPRQRKKYLPRLPERGHKDYQFVPPMNHESWETRTQTLLEFLGETRTWKELAEWSEKDPTIGNEMFLRQLLAWLSVKNLIKALGDGTWRQNDQIW